MAETVVSSAIKSLVPLIQYGGGLLLSLRPDLEFIKNELDSMRCFLEEADKRAEADKEVKAWVSQVRELAYDVEDCVDDFAMRLGIRRNQRYGSFALPRRAFFYLKTTIPRLKMATDLRDLKTRAREVKERSERYKFEGNQPSSSTLNNDKDFLLRRDLYGRDSDLVGIEESKKQLIGWLMEDNEQLLGISVVGMGGLGKTTLVRKAYESVSQNFTCHDWVSVSQSFDRRAFLKQVLIKFSPKSEENDIKKIDCEGTLIEKVKDRLINVKYLIVFDDLWSAGDWKKIIAALPENSCGSRVIVTTRKNDVANKCAIGAGHVFNLSPLPGKEAWELFCKNAFIANQSDHTCPPEMKELILAKCGGLPLAIVVIAGHLAHKTVDITEWKSVLHSLNSGLDKNEDIQWMENILNLSYNDLPHHLRTCFLYLSIFPEDYRIKSSNILRLWSAEGFVEEKRGLSPEDVGDRYLKELASRNMIQEIERDLLRTERIKSFRLHDCVLEMLVKKAKNENLVTFLHQPSSHLPHKIRRISIVKRVEDNSSVVSMDFSHVRSVTNFVTEYSDPFCLSSTTSDWRKTCLPPSMKQVRVLHLRACRAHGVPDEISELHHLRYLYLRGNRVMRFPKWLGNKEKLQTLDMDKTFGMFYESQLINISNLQQLRHFTYCAVALEGGFRSLTSLQTLWGLEVSGTREILKDLEELTQLRKLYMITTNEEYLREIPSLPPHLEKLEIWRFLPGGVIPKCISSHQNIRKLVLKRTRLTEDPFQALHALPKLMELQLDDMSYMGSCLCCQDKQGFPTLKRLYLNYLSNLAEIRIEKGAMPCLEFLRMRHCDHLERVPVGIEHLKNIKELESEWLSGLHNVTEKEPLGEDHWRVRHIPSIKKDGIRLDSCMY